MLRTVSLFRTANLQLHTHNLINTGRSYFLQRPGVPTRGFTDRAQDTKTSAGMKDITYLGQDDAVKLDEDLMGPLGFSVDQLMELAGLSVASALLSEYPPSAHPRALIIAGPGNNGGDGLVAARHLHHFGYSVQVCYPKQTQKPLYAGLVTQCKSLGVPFIAAEELQSAPLNERCDIVLDAVFGFSFKGTPRAPFAEILQMMASIADARPKLVSVDMPSGWDVEAGDESGQGLKPDMLVSLTTPKLGARSFKGKFHYLGGRFVPPAIKEKYHLKLPEYPGAAQCVRLDGDGGLGAAVANIRYNHDDEEVEGLLEAEAGNDPIKLFGSWLQVAVEAGFAKEATAMALATAGEDGCPSVRMVLLKGYDERGFIFFTNYDSRKAEELAQGSSSAALCMYWEPLHRQVRVEGTAEKLPTEESDAYFQSRPRGSQIAAIASKQSSVLAGRGDLEDRYKELEQEFLDASEQIPRPDNWGGYLIRPKTMEFWHGRPSRLHDRLRYQRSPDGTWRTERLSP